MPGRRGLCPKTFSRPRREQYPVRIRSSSSWKGCGTQEGAGEREQVTRREGMMLFREGRESLVGNSKSAGGGVRQKT